MLIHAPALSDLAALKARVVVIGGGPLGLAMALRLSRDGTPVLLLESGGAARAGAAQDLAADDLLTPDTHHDPTITVARRLGGTSNLWGGRCVPYDAIDFEARPWLDLPAWPIAKADLDPWLGPACAALGAGEPVFEAPLPDAIVPRSDAFGVTALERWSTQPRSHLLHRDRLRDTAHLHIATGVTVTGFDVFPEGSTTTAPEGCIASLRLWIDRGDAPPETGPLSVDQVILAAGGNASTRLLLNAQAEHPALFGGPDGPLGRFYMGHVNGQIADIVFDDAALHDQMNFRIDAHGSYSRRRFTPAPALQRDRHLANVVFWPVVPEISQPAHRSGPLSAVFLALTLPGIGQRLIAEAIRLKQVGPPPYRRGPHLANLLRDLPATIGFVPWLLWNRYGGARHRLPGFFLTNPGRRYGLEFHSEHLPGADSRMTLSDRRDRTGLRHLAIDFRFHDRDVDSVLAAHDAFEAWLTGEGYGRLVYRCDRDARARAVRAEAKHGNHQQGTIRMAASAAEGVVDPFGTSFDLANLHVVSTAILPTSSHANPTLTALQIGLRLADRLQPAAPLAPAAAEGSPPMHRVTLPGLGIETSCLGFGCASLGSRVAERPGRDALARALDAGVAWFDVAPAYGAGMAEPILGDVLGGRRDRVQICTKVGLIPPPENGARRALRAVARPLVGALRPLRAAIRKSGTTANRSVALTPELLQSSLERSLTRLGTDRVEVYALHNATPEDLDRDEILRTLEDLIAAGKTRAVAVAGHTDVARAALARGAPFTVVQFPQPNATDAVPVPSDPAPFDAARAAGMGCITHSVFGVGGALADLQARLARTPALRARLAEAGFDGPPDTAAATLLLARARACNPHGVVLASMFSDRSLALNLAEAARPLRPAAITLCTELGL